MSTNIVGASPLAPSDFFGAFRKALKAALPPERRDFKFMRGRGRLIKVHYGDPSFHYEGWHHTGAGRFEVGLHFESAADRNQAAFDFFRARMVEVKSSLPHAELEPWDRGWCRLYETLPAPRLDQAVAGAAAAVMAAYVTALQPMLEQFDVEVR